MANYVKRGVIRVATDSSMSLVLSNKSTEFYGALVDTIHEIAGEIVANDPAIIAALQAEVAGAVAEAVSQAGMVRFVDPGIPMLNRWPADPLYAARETDRLGRMTRGIFAKDGRQHLPLAQVDQLRIGANGPLITWGVPGSGVAFTFKDVNGRMSDLSIGLDGHFLPHTIEYLGKQLGTGGSPNGGRALLVFCGQSNAQTGPSYLTIPGIREEDSRIDMWTGTEIVPLPADDVSMGAEVAREYARNHPGQRVLVVFCGVGSIGFTTTSIQPPPAGYRYFAAGTWDRSLTADPQNRYVKAVALTLGALAAAGPGSWIEAAFWSQGEADGGLTQAQYLAKAVDVFSNFRIDVGVPDLPWVIGSMTPEMHVDHEGFEQIARALADVPRALERTGFVWGPANGHRYNQTVHYSYAGQIDRAGRMAREGLLEARANVATNEPVSPLNSRVRRNGGTATVEWDRPLCHVDTLAVEYSTNYNPADPTVATWAPALLDTMHGSRATAPVPSATAVVFRSTVTNAVGSTMPALVNA